MCASYKIFFVTLNWSRYVFHIYSKFFLAEIVVSYYTLFQQEKVFGENFCDSDKADLNSKDTTGNAPLK